MKATKDQIITVKNGRSYQVNGIDEANGTYDCFKLDPELNPVSETVFRVHDSSVKSVKDRPEPEPVPENPETVSPPENPESVVDEPTE